VDRADDVDDELRACVSPDRRGRSRLHLRRGPGAQQVAAPDEEHQQKK
jgi:hypothetical protein